MKFDANKAGAGAPKPRQDIAERSAPTVEAPARPPAPPALTGGAPKVGARRFTEATAPTPTTGAPIRGGLVAAQTRLRGAAVTSIADDALGSSGRTADARLTGQSGLTEAATLALEGWPKVDLSTPPGTEPVDVVFLVKPLALELGVGDKVRDFLEASGAEIAATWSGSVDTRRIAEHYRHHASKPVFGEMIEYFTGQEAVAYRVKMPAEKIPDVRAALGSYKPQQGTLRGHLVGDAWRDRYRDIGIVDNGLHISDSPEEGAREAAVWFDVPPIVSENPHTQQAHRDLFATLSKLDPGLQFAGSQLTGLAIEGKKDDLDFRALVDDVDEAAAKLRAHPDISFRREGTDPKSGHRFLLFESSWPGGKADIAIVPRAAYKDRVSASVLARYLPEDWKADVRGEKESWRVHMERAREQHGYGSTAFKAKKKDYERTKKAQYRTVKRFFGFTQRTGPNVEIPELEVPRAALSARLEQIEQSKGAERRASVEAVVNMLPEAVRGAVLEQISSFEPPEVPKELQAALTKADARMDAREMAQVERHGARYEAHQRLYEPFEGQVKGLVEACAKSQSGVPVLTSLKGSARAIDRAVRKGSFEAPNWLEIKDVCRASVVVNDPRAVGAAVDEMTRLHGDRVIIQTDRSGEIVKVPKNRFGHPVGGYYDYMLKLDLGPAPDGGALNLQAEVQFHLPEMFLAKELGKAGHDLYVTARRLPELFSDPEVGPAAQRYFARLDVAMRDHYGALMELARARFDDRDGKGFLHVPTPRIDRLVSKVRAEKIRGR